MSSWASKNFVNVMGTGTFCDNSALCLDALNRGGGK